MPLYSIVIKKPSKLYNIACGGESALPCGHPHGLTSGRRWGRCCCRRGRQEIRWTPPLRLRAAHEHQASSPRNSTARGPPWRATLDRRRADPPDSGAVCSWWCHRSGHCKSDYFALAKQCWYMSLNWGMWTCLNKSEHGQVGPER